MSHLARVHTLLGPFIRQPYLLWRSKIVNQKTQRQWQPTCGGDTTVSDTWPCAMPSHDSAFLAGVITTARYPDHGHKTEEYENPTCKK